MDSFLEILCLFGDKIVLNAVHFMTVCSLQHFNGSLLPPSASPRCMNSCTGNIM